MPVTTNVSPTSDPEVNGLLYEFKWGVNAFTFAFPTSAAQYDGYEPDEEPFNNFETMNAVQRAAVRTIFANFSAVATVTFTELGDASAGSADLRLAMSDETSTGWAYLPTAHPKGGDAWFNNSLGRWDNPVNGTYSWMGIAHELGHAMGLKHPHDTASYGLGTMSAAYDSQEFTVMSYRAYSGQPGTGYGNETSGFAQTLMMYDIAALQYLYGANFAHNAGATTYRWNPATGEMSIDGVGQGAPGANRVFMTVWDGGGEDRYDFSLYTANLTVNLAPGGWSTASSAQLAYLGGGVYARGNVANAMLYNGDTRSLIENATGGSGNDTITGNGAVNKLDGGAGNDTLDGAAGADILTGGSGDDLYYFDDLGDQAVELAGGGTDEIRTALGSRTDFSQLFYLPAAVENLTGTSASGQGVFANALDNVVTMGAGNDLVVLHDGGNDTVYGGGGDDFLHFGNALTAADTVDGGAGYDTIGLLGTYALVLSASTMTGIEKLAVYSSGGAGTNSYNLTTADGNVAAGQQLMVVGLSLLATESLAFNGQAETDGSFNIRGGRGTDTLTGGLKNDQIYGNLGADILKGGGGNDVFEYSDTVESNAAARDTILDFSAGDRVNLIAIDADGNAANGNSKFSWIGSGAFTQVAGQLRAYQLNGLWIVEGDTDGNGIADLVIGVTTTGGHALGASDFWL